MLESKASQTRKRVQARAAKIIDLFSYKRKLYYIKQKQPPPPYVPSSDDIRGAIMLARMKSLMLRDIEQKIDEYFRKLPIILIEDPSEITFSHFLKWADKL